MWITSPPLEVEEAREALQKAVPDLDEYFKKGQIEITSYNNWYLLDGKFDSNRVLQGWVEKEKAALKHRYKGMRLAGNTFWIEREYWKSFVDYEEAVNSVIEQHRILALCTYCLKNCNGTDVMDAVRNHVGTLIKQDTKWSLIEDAAQRKKTKNEYSKHLEQLVEERTKQLRDSERLAAIGATARMVGHDIRNPLQAIIGDTFLAKTDLSSCPESEQKASVQENLLEIEKNVEYINKIVADLQDFAKPLNPIAMETDLKRIIDNVVSDHRIPENIQASIKVEKGAEKIVADSAYVQRILSNLIKNAVQAMPNGGKLTVQAFCEGKDNVIAVEDTGVGIPEEAKRKLFTPLFTTKSKGQGFGLAVVKRMTEALGGTVTFDSQINKGTKFIIRLPKKTNGKQVVK